MKWLILNIHKNPFTTKIQNRWIGQYETNTKRPYTFCLKKKWTHLVGLKGLSIYALLKPPFNYMVHYCINLKV